MAIVDYSKYKLKRCNESDIDSIMALQEEIFEDLSDESLLRRNDRGKFEKSVESPNIIYGVYDKDVLMAISIFFVPSEIEDDISKVLYNKVDGKSANYKLVLVRKDYRGLSLQKILIWLIEKYAYNLGYDYLCATVSPNNTHSFNNILNSGFELDHQENMYGSLLRSIFVKDIRKSVGAYNDKIDNEVKEKLDNASISINNDDLSKYFVGDIGLALTGDILEYKDMESSELYYGVYMCNSEKKVLLYNQSMNRFELVDYSENVDNMKLNKVYINTSRG